jgi:hypothetical protein
MTDRSCAAGEAITELCSIRQSLGLAQLHPRALPDQHPGRVDAQSCRSPPISEVLFRLDNKF